MVRLRHGENSNGIDRIGSFKNESMSLSCLTISEGGKVFRVVGVGMGKTQLQEEEI